MASFLQFLRSPVARHPRLLARDIATRLGLGGGAVSVPPPPVKSTAYPGAWAPALRRWLDGVPLAPAPHSFARVFELDFEEAELLRQCRQGPQRNVTGLLADVKLAWDFSRAQALFTNAAADPETVDRCAAFLSRWLEANVDTRGPAWACAMESAIRAVNWIFADVLFQGELSRRLGREHWAAWLWRHGYLVWHGLEARVTSSNHYLADLLGLLVIGSVFPQDRSAQVWSRFARGEFPRALLGQMRADGGLAEASLRYHAYVTEMALLVRLAQGGPFPPAAEALLKQMCRIVADFQDATGNVFAFGDDDTGRVLAVDFASPLGRAELLLRLAASLLSEPFPPAPAAVYPKSGWWVRRAGEFVVALEFGGVGICGKGAHAHNDDFSICVDWRGRGVIVDPGTFLYTSDVAGRNRFRSTKAHNTLIVNDQEQRPLGQEPFSLPGQDTAFACAGEVAKPRFTRPVGGVGLSHIREVCVGADGVVLKDVVEGEGQTCLEWRFQLHPDVRARLVGSGFLLEVPAAGLLLLEPPESSLEMSLAASEYSPGYGRCEPSWVCVARGRASLPHSAIWRLRVMSA